MKRLAFGVIVIAFALGAVVFYTYPRHVARVMKGVEYRVGAGHPHIVPVTIRVHGTLRRSLTGLRTFQGILRISGASVSHPDDNRPLTIRFDSNGAGIMAYGYDLHGRPITHGAGVVFINHDMSRLTIQEFTPGAGWTATDGLTISAPARGRSEALQISNELMKKWLKGYVLQ